MGNKDVPFGSRKRKKGAVYWRRRAALNAAKSAGSQQPGQVHTPAAVENVAAPAGEPDQDLVSRGIQGTSRIRCQLRPKKQQQQLASVDSGKVSRAEAESSRAKAESSRAKAESSRAKAESSRAKAEFSRAKAEFSRASGGPPRSEHPVLMCDPCGKPYLGREALLQHVIRCHLPTPRFQCALCPSLHPELRPLMLHWQSTHQGTLQYTPLDCELCGKLRGSRTDLQAHVRRVHGAYLVCHVCGHVSISPSLLQTHYLTRHDPRAWSKHVVTIIKRVNRKLTILAVPICFICKAPYENLNNLRLHVLFGHLKLPRYQCSNCDFAGVNRDHIQRHIKDQHPGVGDTEFTTTKEMKGVCKTQQKRAKKFKPPRFIPLKTNRAPYYGSKLQCEFCTKLYTIKNALRVHMVQEHLDLYHFKCLNCDFTHATKSAVHHHWSEVHCMSPKIITNDLYCEICMEHFRTDPDLQGHILARHSGELQCVPCRKIFSSVGKLREHLLLKHQPEAWELRKDALYKRARRKAYKCAKDSVTGQYTCFMCRIVSYSTNDSLLRHVVSAHLKVTLFECKICPYKCGDRGMMKSHRSRAHAKSTTPHQKQGASYLGGKISTQENVEFTINDFEVLEPVSLKSGTWNQTYGLEKLPVNTACITQENVHDGVLYLDSGVGQSAACIETVQRLTIESCEASFEFVVCDPLLEDPEVTEDPLAISCPMESQPQNGETLSSELKPPRGEKSLLLSFPQDLSSPATTSNIEKEIKQEEEECFIKEETMEVEV